MLGVLYVKLLEHLRAFSIRGVTTTHSRQNIQGLFFLKINKYKHDVALVQIMQGSSPPPYSQIKNELSGVLVYLDFFGPILADLRHRYTYYPIELTQDFVFLGCM